ncbi:MAG: hypothetical protein ABIH86_06440, partial [Planctomycetota bacterium]
AGANQSSTLPVNSVILDGTVTDPDDVPIIFWSLLSGSGSVSFDDSSDPATTAAFTNSGVYVLRLSANDGTNPEATDDVTISILPETGGNDPGNTKTTQNTTCALAANRSVPTAVRISAVIALLVITARNRRGCLAMDKQYAMG